MDNEAVVQVIVDAIKNASPELDLTAVLQNILNTGNDDVINFIQQYEIAKKIDDIFEVLRLIKTLSPILNDFSKITKNNPKFDNMTLEEAIETEEFFEFIKKGGYQTISQQFKLIDDFVSGNFENGKKIDIKNMTTMAQEKKIELLKSIIPKNYYISNNKLSNEMTKDFVNKGEILLKVINPNKKGEIRTYNSLIYEGQNINITGRYDFKAYDRAIHNAACSLWAAGNEIITPAMVYRTINGMTEQTPSPQSLEAVFQSLYNSRFLKLIVDYTDEAEARGIMGIDKFKIDSYLLPADVVTVEAGGHKIEAFKFLKPPPLYEYAQLTGQIISVPLSLLDTQEATRNTEAIISIKEYLIRRIEIMKHTKSMSNKIVYDTIFEETSILIKHQTERGRYRKYIKAILELWQGKSHNYIKGFREYKDGQIFKGIEIIY